MRTLILHVQLPGTGRVWRKIEIAADQTLEDLHYAIQSAFGWDADHLYSFFMSGKAWDSASEYRLPEDALMEISGDWELEDEAEEEHGPLVAGELQEEERDPLAAFGAMSEQELEDMIVRAAELMGISVETLKELLEQPVEEGDDVERDVRITELGDLNLGVGQEFMYLFDYGDEWRFTVRVHKINEQADEGGTYPRVVQSVGTAPEQYPIWDEEDTYLAP